MDGVSLRPSYPSLRREWAYPSTTMARRGKRWWLAASLCWWCHRWRVRSLPTQSLLSIKPRSLSGRHGPRCVNFLSDNSMALSIRARTGLYRYVKLRKVYLTGTMSLLFSLVGARGHATFTSTGFLLPNFFFVYCCYVFCHS